MNDRVELEKKIIGACFIDKSAFAKVVYVLKESNFTHNDEQLIWRHMKIIWPTSPIDGITVWNSMKKSGVKEYNQAMYQAYKSEMSVSGEANVVSWAFILLEEDIKRACLKVLIKYRDLTTNLNDNALIQEAIEHFVAPKSDVFGVLEASINYFKAHRRDDVFDDLKEVSDMIDTRVQQIKLTNMLTNLKKQQTFLENSINTLTQKNI